MRFTRWAWSRDVREWKGDGHRGCVAEGLQASQVGKEVFVDGGALDELEGVDVWEQVQISSDSSSDDDDDVTVPGRKGKHAAAGGKKKAPPSDDDDATPAPAAKKRAKRAPRR